MPHPWKCSKAVADQRKTLYLWYVCNCLKLLQDKTITMTIGDLLKDVLREIGLALLWPKFLFSDNAGLPADVLVVWNPQI